MTTEVTIRGLPPTRPLLVGIDPDLERSGFALWNSTTRQFDVLTTFAFFDLLECLKGYGKDNVYVYLEASWLRKTTVFGRIGEVGPKRVKVAENIGKNRAVGQLIQQWLEQNGYAHALIDPSGTKWDAATFMRLTGLKKGYNSEIRDSAKLVFGR